ncbi:MAG: class I SAM-dependent methyltransferase [Stappiaceae bacterium]
MTKDKFQLTRDAALKYDSHSVPAMFAPLALATMEKIELPPNAHVIDVACGTGALTREITSRLAGCGRIVGVDLNETMVKVAKDNQPGSNHEVEWYSADVCKLPCEDKSFDVGFIQQGLQFFPDKLAALMEVRRVLRRDGQLNLTCWRAVSPFNGALADPLERHVSETAATKARAPFSFRDGDVISQLLSDAGYEVVLHDAVILERRFDDLHAQIMALPIEADLRKAGEATIDTVVAEVAEALTQFRKDGTLAVPQEAHLFCAKPVSTS